MTPAAPGRKMAAATFLLEGRVSTAVSDDTRVWEGTGTPGLSLRRTADGAFDLRHRDLHLRSDPGLVQPGEAYRLIYRNSLDGSGGLEVQSLDRPGVAGFSAGFATDPGRTRDFVPSEPAIRAFGGLAALANHNAPFADGIGVTLGAQVMTAAGPRAAETLRPGDVVLTDTGARAVVQSVDMHDAVTLGSMNAVRLRAPYFGLAEDLIVTRRTPIMLSGPEVDYTFGAEAVSADAGDLVDAGSILRDLSEPVRRLVTLTLDRPGCICVGRVRLGLSADAAAVSHVDRRGAQALLSLSRDARRLIG